MERNRKTVKWCLSKPNVFAQTQDVVEEDGFLFGDHPLEPLHLDVAIASEDFVQFTITESGRAW